MAALLAAGFAPASPNAADAALPSRQVVRRGEGDAELYLYADPLGCRCVLRGDRQAFARFQLAADEARHAADERNGAKLNREARLDWEAWWPGWIW